MIDKKEYYKQWRKDNKEKKAEYDKQWRRDNLEHIRQYEKDYRERRKENDKRHSKEKQKYVNEYKLSKGCSICGYNKCAEALEFHHNGEKGFTISRGVSSRRNLKKIKEEMGKCNILCANCHAELHTGGI